ncbi:hypothetical protein BJX66DRAFT_208265 [Aspergillus keveii]|uniref:protein-histidine N-methyltransferase n=1 Tax=Aspergillus keveii TaxID=714993 RepID=A0ABR4G510_9EURO
MSGFSFGFSGDDIDIDDADVQVVDQQNVGQGASATSTLPELVQAQRHEMNEWLPTLPSQISYNKCMISSFQGDGTSTGITVARRDVFDIRAQLMVEDSAEEQNGELIAGLEKGDIKPNFYEGGFKTWECSIDLGRLVAGEEMGDSHGHVVELGAGTAVPSLTLFAQLLSRTEAVIRKTHFTFADYNSAVLRLVTLPNLILTWNYIVTRRDVSSSNPQPQEEGPANESEEEMLDITPDLLSAFQTDLARRGITISFVSGAWSPSFVDLVFSAPELVGFSTLILASETIYSPASLGAFSETLLALLRRPFAAGSRALVAAKKVYFGVGGGVDEFLGVLRTVSDGGVSVKVEERLDVKSEGVGRTILEIGIGE